MDCASFVVFGKRFNIQWRSPCGRIVSDGKTCYRFTSFACHEKKDNDSLALWLPRTAERCLIRLAMPSKLLVATGTTLSPALVDWNDTMPIVWESVNEYVERTCLNPKSFEACAHDAMAKGNLPVKCQPATSIDPERLPGLAKAGAVRDLKTRIQQLWLQVVRLTLSDEKVLLLRDTMPCAMPSEAQAFFGLASQREYFHSYADAAKYAQCSERTIRNWARSKYLTVEKKGRKYRIQRAELDKCNSKLNRRQK